MNRTEAEVLEFQKQEELERFLNEDYHWPLDHVYAQDTDARGWLIIAAEDGEYIATSYLQGDENGRPIMTDKRVKMMDMLDFPVTVIRMRYYADPEGEN
jgi:hypothetical protein